MIYSLTTENIRIDVLVFYVQPEDRPTMRHDYLWAYEITITNQSDKTVKLLRRHWEILDDLGGIEIVDGEGVVGEQPLLMPQDSFDYRSACPLKTPSGSMNGYYLFEDQDALNDEARHFKVFVPQFSLHLPHANQILN